MRLFLAIIIAYVIYRIQHSLYRNNWKSKLNVAVRFRDYDCSVGDKNVLIETINNAKSLPLPVLHAKFSVDRGLVFENLDNSVVTDGYYRNDVFCVLGNQKITRQLVFCAQKRGYYEIPSVELVAKDFFLLGFFAQKVKNHTNLHVHPAPIVGEQIDTLSMTLMGDLQVRKNLLEDPFVFSGIREYTYGDAMRRVNWKASARTGALMVNQYQYSSDQCIKILLNMEPYSMDRPEGLQEESIGLASELCGRYLQENVPVMFESNALDKVSKTLSAVEQGSSIEHQRTINRCLARVDGYAGYDKFIEILERAILAKEKNVSYVIISPYCREDLLEKIDYLQEHDIPVRMIVPYYNKYGFSASRDYIYEWQVKYNGA